MKRNLLYLPLAICLVLPFGLGGCDKAESPSAKADAATAKTDTPSTKPAAPAIKPEIADRKPENPDPKANAAAPEAPPSPMEAEARAAVLAEIGQHWVKGPDGWVTSTPRSQFRHSAERWIRQVKEIAIKGVKSADLTDSDRLNGMEWVGEVTFGHSPSRAAGWRSWRLPGFSKAFARANTNPFEFRLTWTQWEDVTPGPLQVRKVKGQWQFPEKDQGKEQAWIVIGAPPAPEDFPVVPDFTNINKASFTRISKVRMTQDEVEKMLGKGKEVPTDAPGEIAYEYGDDNRHLSVRYKDGKVSALSGIGLEPTAAPTTAPK